MDLHNHPLYGKRKKQKPACANPLFLQWLTEWREEAAEKGWKTQYVYGKAIKSLKSYPLPLATGKDCKILDNFGDKTCKLIDEKLAEHIELNGCVVPPDPVDVLPRKVPSKPKKKNQTVPNTGNFSNLGNDSRTGPAFGDAEHVDLVNIPGDVDLAVTPPQKRAARPRNISGEQEYIPAYRSGGYAIMLALYRDTQENKQGCCTPGKNTHRLSTHKIIQSKKKKAMTTIRDASRKRQLKLEFKTNGELSLERREVTQKGDTIEDTPPPCEMVPAPIVPTTDIYFDLETTGLGRTSSITQMAAVRGRNQFSCFVMPKKRMTRDASKVTGIRVSRKKMYRYGKLVRALSLNDAFKELYGFLSKTQNNILVGHNIQTYDCPILMHALTSCDRDITEKFSTYVHGFMDTKKLFRIIHPSQKSYTQEYLVETLLGQKYKAHDALQDVVALQKLVRSVDFDNEARQKASFSIKDVMDSYTYSLHVKENLPSLETMVNKKVISGNVAKSIAGSGLSYNSLQTEHSNKGREGIESVFTATKGGDKVCVTRSRKIIDSVSDYLSAENQK